MQALSEVDSLKRKSKEPSSNSQSSSLVPVLEQQIDRL
jgi:chromosome segregation ATPase